ncbi:MAG: hypothetical protein GMKNLPBB_01228 [Myxococcota bacterium]|nr:hypothetical protein [Myxococcota bacterium]
MIHRARHWMSTLLTVCALLVTACGGTSLPAVGDPGVDGGSGASGNTDAQTGDGASQPGDAASSPDGATSTDAKPAEDSGTAPDTGENDAGAADVEPADAGSPDSAPTDAGPADIGGPADNAPADASVDAGPADTGPDSSVADNSPADTGASDSGGSDSGGNDGGGTVDLNGKGPNQALLRDDIKVSAGARRNITLTVCIPSSDGKNAGPGPYPLLIISPGFQMGREQYKSYCQHAAEWGFVAVTQTYSQSGFTIDHDAIAGEFKFIIDWAGANASGLNGIVDLNKVAAAGHSLGGKLSILAAIKDARIKAVAGWDPVDANRPSVTPEQMPNFKVPLMALGETLDSAGSFQACAPAADNYTQYYDKAGSPAWEITINGADHMDWVDNPSCPVCGFCKKGTLDDKDVKSLSRRTTIAFLRKTLLGDNSMDAYLTGDIIKQDESKGLVKLRNK